MSQPPIEEPRTGEVTSAGYWDRHWQSRRDLRRIRPNDGFYGRNGILMRVLRERVGPLRGARIAELGAGSSYRLLALARWTESSATGVDYSREGIESLQAIFAANDMTVDAVLGDVLTFEAAQPFDLIVHWGLIEHFADPAPIIRRSAAMLAPGGALWFSVPNMEAWGARIWRRRAPENWSHHIHHPEATIARACESAGLELTTFYFGYPLVHITDWEGTDLLSRAGSKLMARAAHAAALAGWIVPLYHRGAKWLSVERGFVARRPAR